MQSFPGKSSEAAPGNQAASTEEALPELSRLQTWGSQFLPHCPPEAAKGSLLCKQPRTAQNHPESTAAC